MKGCDHDVVYSGQINLSQRYAYICRRCGECGWSDRYVMAQVNLDEYLQLRVLHGWASPRLAPPRLPRLPEPARPAWWVKYGCFFYASFSIFLLVLWARYVIPASLACTGAGISLLVSTLLFLIWKKPPGGWVIR